MTGLWRYLLWILYGRRHRPLFVPQEWESLPFEMPALDDPERLR